jgi:predicted esterase
MNAAGALLFLALVVSCAASRNAPEIPDESQPPRAREREEPTAGAPRAGHERPPPARTPSLSELEVPGFAPALVSDPGGRRAREPLLVAVHGAGDGPEWECPLWRDLLGQRGIILCPRGRALGGRYGGHYHPDHHALAALLEASLEALEQAFGERVDLERAVYAAYSQGATMGALALVEQGASFPRLVLVEGGSGQWNVPRGLAFRKSGGERVLFACGTAGCSRAAERSATWLRKAELDVQVVNAPGAGHTYGGAVAEAVAGALDWLLAGDPRWEH